MKNSKKIAFSLLFFGLSFGVFLNTGYSKFLSDITENKYKEAVYHLQEEGIIDGYDDGTYKPNNSINRAEFIKIIIGSLYPVQINEGNYKKPCFRDINNIHDWFVPFVCLAKEKEIIKGYAGQILGAGNTINLAEASKIVSISYFGADNYKEVSSPWYKIYIQDLLNKKILPPSLTNFDQLITRGDMAEIISRTLRFKENKLDAYLDFRKTNYGESSYLTWNEMSGEAKGKTSSDALVQAYNIPRYDRKIVNTEHPGEFVDSGYLSSYSQWTTTDYEPSVQNQKMPLEKESALREELFNAINIEREKIEKPLLKYNSILNDVAQNFAEHLVINAFYSHMDMLGKKPLQRALNQGYEGWVSESMVWKKKSVKDAIDWWKSSTLHWNNLTNERYTELGIGVTEEPEGGYLFILMTGEEEE